MDALRAVVWLSACVLWAAMIGKPDELRKYLDVDLPRRNGLRALRVAGIGGDAVGCHHVQPGKTIPLLLAMPTGTPDMSCRRA